MSRQTDEPKGMLLGGGARRRDVLGVCSSEITIGVNMRGEMIICQEVMLYNRREETTGGRARERYFVLMCSVLAKATFKFTADRKLVSFY